MSQRSFRPCVELLEDRLALAVDFTFDPASDTLTVNGDGANDTITVTRDPATGDVTVNGFRVFDAFGGQPVAFAAFVGLEVNGGGGTDTITVDGRLIAGSPLTIKINGGDGDDTITVKELIDDELDVAIDTGDGTNTVRVDRLLANENLTVDVQGGRDNDDVSLDGLQAVLGKLLLKTMVADGLDIVLLEDLKADKDIDANVDGGDGGGNIDFAALFAAGGNVRIVINGGNGPDNLGVNNVNANLGAVFNFDAGAGNDNIGINGVAVTEQFAELNVQGGDGNDVINVAKSNNVVGNVFGGAGDDLLNFVDLIDQLAAQDDDAPLKVDGGGQQDMARVKAPDDEDSQIGVQQLLDELGGMLVDVRRVDEPLNLVRFAFQQVAAIEVVGGNNAVTTSFFSPGQIPVMADQIDSAILDNRGLNFEQDVTAFRLPGFGPIVLPEDTAVVQENLSAPREVITKTARLVGGLIEYTVTITNDDSTQFQAQLEDSLVGGKFHTGGLGDFQAVNKDGNRFVADAALPPKSSRTIRYFVKPAAGTVTNSAKLIVPHPNISGAFPLDFVEIRADSVTIHIPVAPAGAKLNDVALNGTSSKTSSVPDSIPLKLAGSTPLYTTGYTDIYLNSPNNSTIGHLAYGDPFMVDVAPDGFTPGNGFASDPSGDAAGRLIAFRSTATNLVAGVTDVNATNDIFLRDMFLGTTVLVSRTSADPNRTGNGNSLGPVVSGDGRYVYFLSLATDLVATPVANSSFNLYRFTVATGALELVNVNAAGTAVGDKGVSGVSTSFNGDIVAFGSAASNLTAEAQNNGAFDADIFVRNMVAGVTELVSRHHTNATTGNAVSQDPTISRDGTTIVYGSSAVDLVTLPDANNGQASKLDIFAYDVATRTNTLVSVNAAGSATANKAAFVPRIAAGGRFVLFQSQATDLVTGIAGIGTNVSHLYVRDLDENTTTILTVDPTGTTAGNAVSTGATISDDGRFVSFHSLATNLTGHADTNNNFDVYVRDRLANLTTLASVNALGNAAGERGSVSGGITGDGNTVFFTSFADNLVGNDRNNNNNVFSSDDHLRFRFRLDGDGNPTNLLLRRNGANYEIVNAGTNAVLATRPVVATQTIVIDGADNENDTLTIDLASRAFELSQGILFNGGAGGTDQLIVLGNLQNVSYGPISTTDGLGEFDGLVISYQNLEGFEDRSAAATRTFLVPESDNPQARVADDGVNNNGRSRIDDNGTGQFLAHVFANPTTTLTVEGTRGDDTLTGASVDAGFTATVGFNGRKGNDTLTATALNVSTILRGGLGNDVVRGGAGNDLLADGAGDDDLNGGGGNDTYQLTPGSADVVTDSGGSDTVDFRFATAAISIDLDLVNVAQVVNVFGDTVRLVGDIENFVGSAFNDTLAVVPRSFARVLQGNPQVIGLAPGDVLNVSGGATDDGTRIRTPGFGDLNYAGMEDVNLSNIPTRDGGDVQVTLVSGKLNLTGDVKDNFVRIELGVNGKNTVRVTGLEGTRLNGQAGPLEFANVKKGILAGLGDGHDRIELTGSQVAGTMKLDGGNGDDVYRLATTKTLVKVVDTVGSDRLDFSGAAAGVKVNLASTLGQAVGSGNTLTLKGMVEQLVGSAFDDVLKGNTAANILLGLAGNDRLTDKKGQNLLIGGTGADTLTGGTLADVLIGSRTVFDDDAATLTAILAEFIQNGRTNLDDAGDDPRLVLGDTVLDDGIVDAVFADATDFTFA